jgi:Protein of unknown function (DUF2637)
LGVVGLLLRKVVAVRSAAVARNLSAAVVAGIAAFSSYSHMVQVALRYGERPEVAHALPFSVDGMLVVASVVMVDDRRQGRPVRAAARVAFTAGVAASIAANIAAAHPQPGARLVAAWPALALLLVVEMLTRPARRAGTTQPAPTSTPRVDPPAPPEADHRHPHPAISATDRSPSTGSALPSRPPATTATTIEAAPPASTAPPRPARQRRPAALTRQLAESILAGEPHLTRTELAARVGISRRRLRQVLAEASPITPPAADPPRLGPHPDGSMPADNTERGQRPAPPAGRPRPLPVPSGARS